jgi:CheY-like chemotaxis protein
VRLAIDLPVVLPAVRVDPNQLELALLNLGVNARDAMPMGGRLAITARCGAPPALPEGLAAGRYVCLSVEDTGTGMDDATLKRAAEPFFTTKGSGRGTGLGLSMVHGLAAQSGGVMRIRSRVGEGTIVDLWLPAPEDAVAEDAASLPVAAEPARPLRVLVVDDDPLILESTGEMLRDLGHDVIEAASAVQALDALQLDAAIDVVITDHAMPGITGTELARAIRRRWPQIPVILATGYADLPVGQDGGLLRLAKPYLQPSLAAQLSRAAASIDKVVSLEAARRA